MDAIRKSEQTITVKRREFNSAKKDYKTCPNECTQSTETTMNGLDALGAVGSAGVAMAKNELKFSQKDLNKIAVVAKQENLSRDQINKFKEFTLNLMKERGFETLEEVNEWFKSPETDPNDVSCVISCLDYILGKDVYTDGGFMGYPFRF